MCTAQLLRASPRWFFLFLAFLGVRLSLTEMNTSPLSPLPVCAYDGRCYRKNPQHFQQFAHPKQYPSPTAAATTAPLAPAPQQLDDAPINVDSDDSDTPPLKRQQREDGSNPTSSPADDDGDTQQDPSSAPVLEADMASPALLLHFLSHPPHRATFLSSPDPVDALDDEGTAAPPRLDAAHNWAGVAQVLQEAYAGMGFHPADVQCVLTAARALKPSDPLSAFPGWRLVGPFELAVRYGDVCSSGGDGSALNAALRGILKGRNAEEEVRRWRCGRFRYDPPECQCVAVQVSDAATAATGTPHRLTPTQLLEGGLHLCFHRDHPTDGPGMLVSGTARSPTFQLVNGEGALSPYLCAWYHAADDAAAPTVVQALKDALHALSSGPTALSDSRRLSVSFSKSLAEQRRGCATRSKEWVAATHSRLGLCVPVDRKTGVGYREPNIPSNVSFAKCLRDAEADFVKSFNVTAAAPSSADPHGAGGTTTAAAAAAALVPFSRSVNYDSLAGASVFTKKCSDCLDDIFLWADVANDEGDFGTSLELGLNAFSCIVADRSVATAAAAVESSVADSSELQQQQKRRLEQPTLDPVLWHTFRLLDCAYMLLQRPLYRHILRCHLPLLASADNGVSFDV